MTTLIYRNEYYQNNREKILADKKAYYQKNKAKKAEYRKLNKEKIIECRKKYLQTEQGKKINRIGNWKSKGVISDDFDALYEIYMNINNCENCDIELVNGSGGTNKKHLDHDHNGGLFRNVLCGTCNIRRR
tara:strand:+ start:288 stop:680 length:393 start_codon:yes stop_codon:yes gene_type:complete